MAHCGILLKRDFPGLYDKAKSQAMADVANGFQASDFKTMAAKARNDLALVQQRVPALAKKVRRLAPCSLLLAPCCCVDSQPALTLSLAPCCCCRH